MMYGDFSCYVSVGFVAVLFSSLCQADNCENYIGCAYDASYESIEGIEAVTVLRLSALPDDVTKQCADLQSVHECYHFYQKCCQIDDVYRHHRFGDATYTKYLANLALYVCEKWPEFVVLKTCFTHDLEQSLQTCITEDGYDLRCLHDNYDEGNNCTDDADDTFDYLVDHRFIKAPFLYDPIIDIKAREMNATS